MPDVPDHRPPAPVLSYASLTNKVSCDPMRSGRFVVVGDEALLPPRCVLCNTAAQDPPLHLKLYPNSESFHYEGLGEFRLFARGTDISLSLCRRHLRRRRRTLAVIALLAIGVLSASAIGICAKSKQRDSLSNVSCLSGVLLTVGIGIASAIGTKGPRCHHFQGGYYYLEGFGRPFLQSLPEAPLMNDK